MPHMHIDLDVTRNGNILVIETPEIHDFCYPNNLYSNTVYALAGTNCKTKYSFIIAITSTTTVDDLALRISSATVVMIHYFFRDICQLFLNVFMKPINIPTYLNQFISIFRSSRRTKFGRTRIILHKTKHSWDYFVQSTPIFKVTPKT